jgi:hypothetical protein
MVARVRHEGGPFRENKHVQMPRMDPITNSRFLRLYRAQIPFFKLARMFALLMCFFFFTLGTYKTIKL